MKKQWQVGSALASVLGSLLFGATTPDGVSTASAAIEPATHVASQPDVDDEADHAAKTLANLAPKTGKVSHGTPVVAGAETLSCPDGMVEVEGDYCPHVEQRCVRWLDPESRQRCADYEPGSSTCVGHTVHKHFCIDRFEYPNVAGQKPTVMKDWYEAKATCEGEGKRLCGDTEWTLACEGQERLPYPYGYARSANACNIDKPHVDVDETAMADWSRRDAEVARLDQRATSGSYEACVSPYGAYDMTGNVDEWVMNESGKPYKSGLKGGYWGPVRDRCRPMTIAHNELFEFYQIGFRCCGEPGTGAGAAPGVGKAGGAGNLRAGGSLGNHAPPRGLLAGS